jgi:hypothetical protein
MKKITAFAVLAFALVAGTAAVTVQLAPPAYAECAAATAEPRRAPAPGSLSPLALRVPLHHARAVADHEPAGGLRSPRIQV